MYRTSGISFFLMGGIPGNTVHLSFGAVAIGDRLSGSCIAVKYTHKAAEAFLTAFYFRRRNTHERK
jgi:hypothetical protein